MKKKEGLDVDEEILRGVMCYFDKVVKKCYFREDLIIVVVFVMDIILSCILVVENLIIIVKIIDNSE